MYFGKDLEFGFTGSIRLTNNNNDNYRLPTIVYNVKSSETNKKGRGIYYKGGQMYKLTGDRYVNYKPTPYKFMCLIRDGGVSGQHQCDFDKCLRNLDLGIFYGFNMNYYVDAETKNQAEYHRKYMEKYGDVDKCLITDTDDDDDSYKYNALDEGIESDL